LDDIKVILNRRLKD